MKHAQMINALRLGGRFRCKPDGDWGGEEFCQDHKGGRLGQRATDYRKAHSRALHHIAGRNPFDFSSAPNAFLSPITLGEGSNLVERPEWATEAIYEVNISFTALNGRYT